jgi:hypothetical protein
MDQRGALLAGGNAEGVGQIGRVLWVAAASVCIAFRHHSNRTNGPMSRWHPGPAGGVHPSRTDQVDDPSPPPHHRRRTSLSLCRCWSARADIAHH